MFTKEAVSLLQLPDSCLVAVLRCCAGDHRSVCSAARAHSRLHQAAVEAHSSITLETDDMERVKGLLLYLHDQGKHVDSISLASQSKVPTVGLCFLPNRLQRLSSLTCERLYVQLLHCAAYPFQGVLGGAAAAALKQLRLKDCELEAAGSLAAALAQLPDLQHLSIDHVNPYDSEIEVQMLQKLTCLELAASSLQPNGEAIPALQRLRDLTALVDLRLSSDSTYSITASMLSGLQHLTRLHLRQAELPGRGWGFARHEHFDLEPAALSGKTQLQHLELCNCYATGGAAGEGQLLARLGELQQLTYLSVQGSLHNPGVAPSTISAAAYSALTASSQLQHLDVNSCRFPECAWEHMLPDGKQLPCLKVLYATHNPELNRIVSCCPGVTSVGSGPDGLISIELLLSAMKWFAAQGRLPGIRSCGQQIQVVADAFEAAERMLAAQGNSSGVATATNGVAATDSAATVPDPTHAQGAPDDAANT